MNITQFADRVANLLSDDKDMRLLALKYYSKPHLPGISPLMEARRQAHLRAKEIEHLRRDDANVMAVATEIKAKVLSMYD